MDFTVIQAVRQRFGDKERDFKEFPFEKIEPKAPFVGTSKDFPFSCPNVNRGAIAVLQFQSFGVQGQHILRINGVNIHQGITGGPQAIDITPRVPLWNTHSLLVEANVLNEENVMHIECATGPFVTNFDDFIIDNVVVFFKTRVQRATTEPPKGGGNVGGGLILENG